MGAKGEDTTVTETRMQQALAGRSLARNLAWREVIFDIQTARRALVYISRVSCDAARAFATTQICRQELELTADLALRAELSERRDSALRRLNAAIDECNAAGVDLLDIATGSVGFTADVQDQRTTLVWRLGEPIESAWEDLIAEPESSAR